MANSKIALVTGANKGIGFEIARQLGEQKLTVVIAARDVKKATAAANQLKSSGIDAHSVTLDVTDPASVTAAVKWLDGKFGKLDVLINNAGISSEFATGTKPSELSLETFKSTYETNVFGIFTVLKSFLPLLRKSDSARVINQSSTLGSLGVLSDSTSPFYGVNLLAYNSSKTAVNGITLAFSKELSADRISVNSVCPGWVKTDMGGDGAPRTVEQGAAIAVKLATMSNPPTGKYLDDAGEIRW
jgi:NAD(P)-dependent dehydrogenase (short-subunit alcohol dehydrogenase family)